MHLGGPPTPHPEQAEGPVHNGADERQCGFGGRVRIWRVVGTDLRRRL